MSQTDSGPKGAVRNVLRRLVRIKHFGTPEDPYLDRTVLLSTPWFGVYLHHIWREDRDDYPHDHPWPFVTLILRGGYDEAWFPRPDSARGVTRHWGRGSWHRVPLTTAHRIAAVKPGTTTLVIRGRRRPDDRWSFWVPVSGVEARPIDWREYLYSGGKVDVPQTDKDRCECGEHDEESACPYWCAQHGVRWCDEHDKNRSPSDQGPSS